MKVKELISILEKIDQDMIVLVDGYEGGYTSPIAIESIDVTGPHDEKWYYGPYKDCKVDDPCKFKALILRR